MGREGEWNPTPPHPGSVFPPPSSAGIPGVQDSSALHQPLLPPGMSSPSPWGPPGRNVVAQGGSSNLTFGQYRQGVPVGSAGGPPPGTVPSSRPPFPGPPQGARPSGPPPFATPNVAAPGQSSAGPAFAGGVRPYDQQGVPGSTFRGPNAGPPGVPGGDSGASFSGRTGPPFSANLQGPGPPFVAPPGQRPPPGPYPLGPPVGVPRSSIQDGTYPPSSALAPSHGQPFQTPMTQMQNLTLSSQNQGVTASAPPTAFGPPFQGGVPPSGPPTWQTTQRRVYPEFGAATGPPSSQPPQVNTQPTHFHPNLGHMPGPTMTGMPQPGSPAASALPPPSRASNIDPNQIPRPQPTASNVIFDTRVNGQANTPRYFSVSTYLPHEISATSAFIVRDFGNCSPRFMRCTLNQIPCSADLLTTSSMPLALMVQPLALPHPDEEPIQVVDFGESGPVRCSRCKAYINPFMKFVDQGRRFTCNLCGFTNETPRDYHCNLGPDGRRRDADQRPELCRGTVEFVASGEYLVRPPMPAVFFFLVDVSMNAVQTGAVAATCSAINRALADLPEGPNTMVGIATFDSTIHFYSLNKNLQQPAMLVVPDVQDPYTPLQSDLIVPLEEGKDHLEQILESIPSMFQNNRVADSSFGAAIKGAYLAMKTTGGKLMVFQSVLPSIGLVALTPRESEGRTASEKEALKLLQPADKLLKTMAIEFAEFQVCVDLFLTVQNYVDVASLAVVPRTTGGQIYFYQPFYAGADSAKLYNDLRWNVTRPQGFEAVMRVRCSQGLQVQDYYGNFCRRIPTDMDLPAIDSDKTIMVTFKHDDKLQDQSECCFQCALLYTTVTGQRRIRVITLSLLCTTVLTAQEVPQTPLSQVRDHLTQKCVDILYVYRKNCATASSAGQLILPEALKLLPLYTLALTKSIGLRAETRVDAHFDDRSYWCTRVASLAASLSIPLVYPRMFAVHNLSNKETLLEGELPPVVPPSSEYLEQEGVFLLETGEDAFLYVGQQAPAELLEQLFGVHSVDEVVSGQFVLQEFNNSASKRLNVVLNEIRRQRCSYLRLRLVKRGDPLEFVFFHT